MHLQAADHMRDRQNENQRTGSVKPPDQGTQEEPPSKRGRMWGFIDHSRRKKVVKKRALSGKGKNATGGSCAFVRKERKRKPG